MKCPYCGAELENTAKKCPYCDAEIETNQTENAKVENAPTSASSEIGGMNNVKSNKTDKVDKPDKVPFFFQMWFILLVTFFSFAILFVPGIVLFIVRLVKYPKHRKPAIISFACFWGALFIFSAVADYIADADERKVHSFIKNEQYQEAMDYVDANMDATTYYYYSAKADIYEAQNDYTNASKQLINYVTSLSDKSTVGSDAQDRLLKYKDKVSESVQVEIDSAISDINVAKAQKEKDKKEKEELKQKAKQAQDEADKAKKEAKQAKADKEKAESDAAKANSEKEKAQSEAAKATSDKEKAESEAAKAISEKEKAETEAKAKAEETKSQKDNSNKDSNNSGGSKNANKEDAGNSVSKVSKDTILTNANHDFSYKNVMRYRDSYLGDYVVLTMKVGNVVQNTDNRQYIATIVELGDGGLSYDWDERFVIENKKYDKSLTWVAGDIITVYGKYSGIATFGKTNDYTDKEVSTEIPTIDVYYDILEEDYMAYD